MTAAIGHRRNVCARWPFHWRSKIILWYPLKLFDIIMDTTNCNLSKIGSKIIAIRFCETWNRILKACISLKPEGDEKWKPRDSISSNQLCLTSTRHFWKMYRKWKFPNFQIYEFLRVFFYSKAWNLPKTLKILFFVLYDITYIQNTGNGNTYLNLPIN